MSRTITRDDDRDALVHLLGLERVSNALSSLPDPPRALAELQQHIAGMRTYLGKSLDSRTFHELTPSPSAANTFAKPELLEMILLNLDSYDLFQAIQVNRTFRDTINASKALKLVLTRLPYTYTNEVTTNSLSSPIPGFSAAYKLSEFRFLSDTETDLDNLRLTCQIDIDATPVKLGSRVRQIVAIPGEVQKERIELVASCCSVHGILRNPGNKSDLTLGELYHQANKLTKMHRLCRNAPPYDHDERGFVKVSVRIIYDQYVSYTAALASALKFPYASDQPHLGQEEEERQRLLFRYYVLKRRLLIEGRGLHATPTFEQFKKELDTDGDANGTDTL